MANRDEPCDTVGIGNLKTPSPVFFMCVNHSHCERTITGSVNTHDDFNVSRESAASRRDCRIS